MEAEKKRRQFRGLHAALVAAAILAILAFLLLPGLLAAREGALRVRCLRNLEQIGWAMKQYALDNDQVFPWDEFQQDGYYRFLGKLHPNYVDKLDLFKCPTSHDRPMRLADRGDPNSLFKESECKKGLSYAYGHDQGKPWTENARSSTRILADKYATHDYVEEPRPRHRPANHPDRRHFGKPGDRSIVTVGGSGTWDDDLRMLEADPEWNVYWDVSPGAEYEPHEGSDPKHDQTGTDWWSDPPDK
jgi:hypothetical protein